MNLLNKGIFYLRLLFLDESAKHLFDYHNAITLQVIDVEERKLKWFGEWQGLTRPLLNWKTKLLDFYEN